MVSECNNCVVMRSDYDLHTHSLASDGTLASDELVRRAHAAGVAVMALTDHDEVAGVADATAAAADCGLQLVPGIELSVTWQRRTIHIVGLHIDPTNTTLLAGISRLRQFRQWRAEEMGRRLAKQGIIGAYAGARALAQGRSVGRTHFARWLVAKGYCHDIQEVFRHFLKPNRPGYVAGEWATLEEALSWLHGAGGIAVVAHPARYRLSGNKRRQLLGEFRELGGAAIEVVSGSHSADDVITSARDAQQHQLLASAGSDFHDPDNPWIALGQLPPLPPQCQPVWQSAQWPLAA